jgi:predicted  nucleic acid-binding Zn-ribbon protein
MYQEIAVARGSEYDSLNQSMDHCQQNIETLSDEIQRLQGKNRISLEEPLWLSGKVVKMRK